MVGMGAGVNEPDTIHCSRCGAEIPEDRVKEPCPECGSLQRTFSAHLRDGVKFSDSVKVNVLRLFFEQHPKYRWTVRAIGAVSIVGSFFLPHVTGLVVGIAAFVVSDILGGKGTRSVRKQID